MEGRGCWGPMEGGDLAYTSGQGEGQYMVQMDLARH